VIEVIINAKKKPHGDIKGKPVPIGRYMGMHKGIGPIKQKKDIQQIKYFAKLQKLDDIFIEGQNEEKETQRISDPTESPVSDIQILAARKHVKVHKRHQKRQDDKCEDHTEKIQGTPSSYFYPAFYACLI